ncbi:MAG TPA: hypothetical protein VK141_02595 [Nitrosomonas sp.]|nr:hypothetical protein [Nitrosomonas sp.]
MSRDPEPERKVTDPDDGKKGFIVAGCDAATFLLTKSSWHGFQTRFLSNAIVVVIVVGNPTLGWGTAMSPGSSCNGIQQSFVTQN